MYKHLMIWISKANHQMVVPNGEISRRADIPFYIGYVNTCFQSGQCFGVPCNGIVILVCVESIILQCVRRGDILR